MAVRRYRDKILTSCSEKYVKNLLSEAILTIYEFGVCQSLVIACKKQLPRTVKFKHIYCFGSLYSHNFVDTGEVFSEVSLFLCLILMPLLVPWPEMWY